MTVFFLLRSMISNAIVLGLTKEKPARLTSIGVTPPGITGLCHVTTGRVKTASSSTLAIVSMGSPVRTVISMKTNVPACLATIPVSVWRSRTLPLSEFTLAQVAFFPKTKGMQCVTDIKTL